MRECLTKLYTGETLWGRKPVSPCQSAVLRYYRVDVSSYEESRETIPFLSFVFPFSFFRCALLRAITYRLSLLLQSKAELREEPCALKPVCGCFCSTWRCEHFRVVLCSCGYIQVVTVVGVLRAEEEDMLRRLS